MRTPLASALAGLLALSASIAAEAQLYRTAAGAAPTLSYDWAEARVLLLDPDGGDDAEGLRLAASALVQPNLFVTGGLSHVSYDGGADADQVDPGLGVRHPLDANIDLLAWGSLLWTRIDCGACRDDDDLGFGLTGGVRAAVAPQAELGGYLGYAEVFDDGDVTVTAEGLYHATPQLSLLGAVSLSDDVNGLQLGARWNF